MYNYTVTWRGFKGSIRQALPVEIRAPHKVGALTQLASALAGLASLPATVTLTVRRPRQVAGSEGVTRWRAVGSR